MTGVGLSPNVYVALALLAVAGGSDECSATFRDVMWKQSIPDHIRGRMAGIELLSYAAGPPAGQLRSGVVAAVAGTRYSLTSGGVACVVAVGAVWAAIPAFRQYARQGNGSQSGSAAGTQIILRISILLKTILVRNGTVDSRRHSDSQAAAHLRSGT
jgi:hypothetical protein